MNDFNDEFFIDDDIIVSFDDNLIEEVIPSFNVIEERLKDDTILRLNTDQINAEITNLIISNNKNASKLKNKVLKYATLFANYPHLPKIQFKQIAPVILVDKLTYFLNDDEHTQNKEYEHENFLKSDKLSNFLSQFQSLNTNKGYKSSNGTGKLYALYAPFSRRDEQDINTLEYKSEYDVDAIWHCTLDQFGCDNKNQTFRLISKVAFSQEEVYDGDVVDVVGFYNVVKEATNTIVIDIAKYINDIASFKQGDKVQIVFNEPAFDSQAKDLITKTNAKVKFVRRNTIEFELPTPITLKGELTRTLVMSLKSLDNDYFVFPFISQSINVFGKHLLSSHNVLFKFHDISKISKKIVVDEIISFISPTSVGQYIMLHQDKFSKIFNIYDLSKYILKDGGIEIDALTVEHEHLIKYIFAYGKEAMLSLSRPTKRRVMREYPYINTSPLVDFVKYKDEISKYKAYIHYDKLVDDALNRFRYLKSQNDKGAYYFLKRIKHNLTKKYKNNVRNMQGFVKELNKIDKELEKLDLQSVMAEKSCHTTPKQHKFAKEYTQLDALIQDNDKTLYFDVSHDDTQYGVKSGFKGESKREMKLYVLNELTSLEKYKTMSKNELDFEVESIVQGKRRVRIGDVCVLHTFQGDTIYVRQEVAGKQMWVKKFKTPFKICSDNPLVEYNDLMQLDTCIKETFDDVCKSNRNARILHKYRILMSMKTELSGIINLLEKYEIIVDTLETDISYFEHLIDIIPSEHEVKRKFEYIDHVDYEEFTGEEYIEGDTVQYQIDFNDQGNFVITPQSKLTKTPGIDGEEDSGNSKDKQDILNMLLSSIELPIDELEFAYILSNVNAKVSKTSIEIGLKKFEATLWQNVNELGYKTNEKYKSLVDTTMKQKLEKKEVELVKKYHFNTLRFMIAMIIILMFVRYPSYALRKVIPSCISFLSYSGYPITPNDGERSLVKYFACLIAKVTDDMRFELYQDKETKEVEKYITEAIDELLSENYELKVQLEMAKSVFANTKHNTEIALYTIDASKYMTSFKPKYVFSNIDNAPLNYKSVLKYMKAIHDTISKSKIIKQNIVNAPNLFNSCCTEILTKDVDFFNYFENTTTFQNVQKSVSQIKKQAYVDTNLYPPRKEKLTTDIFAKKVINHKSAVSIAIDKNVDETNVLIGKVKEQIQHFILSNNDTYKSGLEGLVDNFNSNNWWYDVFYPKLNDEFDNIVDVLLKVGNNINQDMLNFIKETIISVANPDNSSTIRNTLHMFLKNKLKSIIGIIINKQQSKDENLTEEALKSSQILSIISSVSNNKHYDAVLKSLKSLLVSLKDVDYLYFDTNDNDLILKNISILAYVLLLFFNDMIRATGNKQDKSLSISTLVYDVDIQTKDKFGITSLIINLCCEKLAINFDNNVVDQTYLKMVVERLREQRKEELIAAFRVDDEERMMQNVLKKMGLENWANVFTNEIDDEISEEVQVSMNPQPVIKDEYEEEKDIIYSSYQGENYENDENEEDYVSYEAYDY